MANYNELTPDNITFIKKLYNDKNITKLQAQDVLSSYFETTTRTIRNWARHLELNTIAPIIPESKVLVYDIETSRTTIKTWWTGKQYISHNQLRDEPQIISIAWKWLGEDMVHTHHWDMDTHSDKQLLEEFLQHYNSADMVVGQNNNRFDNRRIAARALKHDLYIDIHVKSYDIMAQLKKHTRLPSYSMAYVTKYLGITQKLSHEGIYMWDMVEDGTPSEQKEYMAKMIEYNIGDIISTEEMYLKVRKHTGQVTHLGVTSGAGKYSCKSCGGTHLELVRTTTTPSGNIQRIMKCADCDSTSRISNTLFLNNN